MGRHSRTTKQTAAARDRRARNIYPTPPSAVAQSGCRQPTPSTASPVLIIASCTANLPVSLPTSSTITATPRPSIGFSHAGTIYQAPTPILNAVAAQAAAPTSPIDGVDRRVRALGAESAGSLRISANPVLPTASHFAVPLPKPRAVLAASFASSSFSSAQSGIVRAAAAPAAEDGTTSQDARARLLLAHHGGASLTFANNAAPTVFASSSSSSSSSSSAPSGILPPPPGFVRFALVDAKEKYAPLVKDYSMSDERRGQLPPRLDFNAPPFLCPFGRYTAEEIAREKQREMQRHEKRKAELPAREAMRLAVQKAIDEGRRPPADPPSPPRRVRFLLVRLHWHFILLLQSCFSGGVYRALVFFLFKRCSLTLSLSLIHDSRLFFRSQPMSEAEREATLARFAAEREATRRAQANKPGYCELCHASYKDLEEVRCQVDFPLFVISCESLLVFSLRALCICADSTWPRTCTCRTRRTRAISCASTRSPRSKPRSSISRRWSAK